jgi:hypothetical protein
VLLDIGHRDLAERAVLGIAERAERVWREQVAGPDAPAHQRLLAVLRRCQASRRPLSRLRRPVPGSYTGPRQGPRGLEDVLVRAQGEQEPGAVMSASAGEMRTQPGRRAAVSTSLPP